MFDFVNEIREEIHENLIQEFYRGVVWHMNSQLPKHIGEVNQKRCGW